MHFNFDLQNLEDFPQKMKNDKILRFVKNIHTEPWYRTGSSTKVSLLSATYLEYFLNF